MKKISMKSLFIKQIVFGLVLTILNIQCTEDVTQSLYSDEDKGVKPVILSMEPTQGLAGVSEIKIIGENFSTKAGGNIVNFGSIPATIVSASTNELVVNAPNLVGDSIHVKISVSGAENFSDSVDYKLEAAVSDAYPFQAFQKPYAVTTDEIGNVYFSLTEDGAGVGVWKLTADSSKLVKYAPVKSETFYDDLKYHSDGFLLGVALKYKFAIFKIIENEVPVVWATAKDKKIVFQAIDFDANKNLWAGGKGGKIASFKPDKTYAEFEYEHVIKSLRVYNNFLYAIVNSDDGDNIVRFQIFSSDSLGSAESVFNFSSKVNDRTVVANSLTFSADGDMYVGTNATDGVLVVYQDGSFGTWYEGLISSEIISFTWTTGTNIFATRKSVDGVSEQVIYKINMERAGAPEFGRD